MSYVVKTAMSGSAWMYNTSHHTSDPVVLLERIQPWPDKKPFWIACLPHVAGYGCENDLFGHHIASGDTRREAAQAAAEYLGIPPF